MELVLGLVAGVFLGAKFTTQINEVIDQIKVKLRDLLK